MCKWHLWATTHTMEIAGGVDSVPAGASLASSLVFVCLIQGAGSYLSRRSEGRSLSLHPSAFAEIHGWIGGDLGQGFLGGGAQALKLLWQVGHLALAPHGFKKDFATVWAAF